jgi:hypothetical protein
MDLHAIEERLVELETRYREWSAPIDRVLKEKSYQVNRAGYTLEDFKADARKVRQEQLAKYNPYEVMNTLLDELCPQYLSASAEERAAVRAAFGEKRALTGELLGYIYKCAERIHSPADLGWLKNGLAAASIENCRVDFRDSLLALAELYVMAESNGLDPQPEFQAMGVLSDTVIPKGGMTPVSQMLKDFHGYAVLAERRQRPASGNKQLF